MKRTATVYLIALLGLIITQVGAQSVNLSFPIDYSVTQRNASNQATITIAGQLTGGSSNAQDYSGWYRISTLNASGGVVSTGGWAGLGIGSTGQFYTTLLVSKGWYRLEIGTGGPATIVSTASVKFGVGDVFVIAGQSNAQGVLNTSNTWAVPSTSGFPEWLVGVNLNWGCLPTYPPSPNFVTITGLNRISPTGNNSWCYAVLGKKISDANSGMPVAFFNTAYGGSSILNWYESSLGNLTTNAYLNNQYCLASGLSSDPNYFKGQPYRTLKNALNYYASLFGVRALLWHQGETDADPNANSSLRTTNTQTYKDRLQQVISQSRTDFGHSELSWMIAQATFTRGGNITTSITNAQLQKGQESDKNVGPNTDNPDNVGIGSTINYRNISDPNDLTHFDESRNAGLTALANEWDAKINVSSPGPAGFNRIVANPVPSVSVSKSGSNRVITVQTVPGAQEYRWGSNIDDAFPRGATLTSITVPATSGSLRCFVRDGSGNWRISPYIYLGCPSCREGVAEVSDEVSELAVSVYPNPFVKDLMIEFDVRQAADVRLEIIDIHGQVVRTLANGYHDKGHWKYPVMNLTTQAHQLYYCRLKVDNQFLVKKLIKIN